MFLCPHCGSEIRSESKFCAKCGKPIAIETTANNISAETNIPGFGETTAISEIGIEASSDSTEAENTTRPIIQTQRDFLPRPDGAIFDDRFLYKSLNFSNEKEHFYTIQQFRPVDGPKFVECVNPQCGAVRLALDEDDNYCTSCGSRLNADLPMLTLVESQAEIDDGLIDLVPLGLSHSGLRAPLANFDEKVGGKLRYCLIRPNFTNILRGPAPSEVLPWGLFLAQALDYLHDNRISFNGDMNESRIGWAQDHPVWTDFISCIFGDEVAEAQRVADIQSLVRQMWHWLQGKIPFQKSPALAPETNDLFEKALNLPGILTASDLVEAIELAMRAPITKAARFSIGSITNVGMVRKLNEDSMFTLELSREIQSMPRSVGIFTIADGMGGHAAGEIASAAIINTIVHQLPTLISEDLQDYLDWMKQAVSSANEVVFKMRASAGTDMGSTLVMAILDGCQAYLAHAGDSRAYRINPHSIEQLTTDHSLVERLVATGQISREEAKIHPQRNVIYRTLGDRTKVEVDTSSHILNFGDRLLLCSDGLSAMVDDTWIQKIVLEAKSTQEACANLISAANNAGGEDNITIILIELTPP